MGTRPPKRSQEVQTRPRVSAGQRPVAITRETPSHHLDGFESRSGHHRKASDLRKHSADREPSRPRLDPPIVYPSPSNPAKHQVGPFERGTNRPKINAKAPRGSVVSTSQSPTGTTRSRSSSGYFLGATMTLILSGIESLHHTRQETTVWPSNNSRRDW